MKFDDMISENRKLSSMRFVFVLMGIAVFLCLLSLSLYIVVYAIRGEQITTFAEIGAFVTSLAAIITGAGWNKAQQKKAENGNAEKNQ